MPPKGKQQEMPPNGPRATHGARTPKGPKHTQGDLSYFAKVLHDLHALSVSVAKHAGIPHTPGETALLHKQHKKADTKAKAKSKKAQNIKDRRDKWALLTPEQKAVDKRAREEAFHAAHSDWTHEQWAERTRKYEERQEKIRESKLRRQEKRDEEIEGLRPEGGYVEKSPAGPMSDHLIRLREMRREAKQRAEDGTPEGQSVQDREAYYQTEYAKRQAAASQKSTYQHTHGFGLGGEKKGSEEHKALRDAVRDEYTATGDPNSKDPEERKYALHSMKEFKGVPSEYAID